jgi:hypothetical protein
MTIGEMKCQKVRHIVELPNASKRRLLVTSISTSTKAISSPK